jgi:Ca2+-binding RTX toxin-like protein
VVHAVLALLLVMSLLPLAGIVVVGAAPVGQGFNLNASDLRFILRQIEIAEQHAATATPQNPCGTLLGTGPHQIPPGTVGETLPWGLRTVDGSCNNLVAGQETFGAADEPFPRLVARKLRSAEVGSYAQVGGLVTDSQPRIISNLIVDQTASNPAAVEAAGEVPQVDGNSYVIPNVAPDVGLSAPYNSWFTLFGQFFDHGLDLVNKGGNGAVMIPLQPDDPLYVAGSPLNFMVLTRATIDADGEAINQTSPFIDQSQTYSSHPSHQVFLRAYEADASGRPAATGGLITGTTGGMATWADVKAQAATQLGIELVDTDALAVPLLRTDPYGRFERGPSGYPLLVTGLGPDGFPNSADDTVVEGDPTAPVGTAGAVRTGHAFLDDIAHHAAPSPTRSPDADPGTVDDADPTTYDDEMLDAHFVAGDGRVNENIGLITVHHVFHSEHNRLTGQIKQVITDDDPAMLSEWQVAPGVWNGERIFQAARFVTEMEYQHLAFEEFARKVQPMVNPFGEGGTGYHTTIDPAIRAEFAHAVYRFGHSMLNETVARTAPNGDDLSLPLLEAFLTPTAFLNGKAPDEAAGDIVRGMTRQVGNELDEFVTEALRNNLLGLPLDLATLNMARARETGVPTLNEARRAFYAETSNSALAPYESWADLGFSLKHEASLANFIAAYGLHPMIAAAATVDGKRAAAERILAGPLGADGVAVDDVATPGDESADNGPDDSYAFLNSVAHDPVDDTGTPVAGGHTLWVSVGGVTTTGVDDIDLWVGGLAERQMVFGGLLGPTFNHVFEAQMEDLQDGDRFYYLSRTAGLNLLTQLEGNSFSELIQRNTDAEGLPADSFSRPDYVFDVAALGTSGPITDDPATAYDESALLVRMPDGTIRYGGDAHVVFNGIHPGAERVRSSEGDDTVRGNGGNDRMEGGDGNDNLIGGEGDDIMTDFAGDDTLKGGDGNDAMSSGQGFGGDLNQGGLGNDLIVGGNDMTETFAGPGDDYVYAGEGDDTVFGDDGDDWIEGGGGAFNLLQGDNGAPFQDDLNAPGHDVLMGFGGETDNDAEGGDDIMLIGPGIQRNEGMLGFDWATHRSDPQPGDSDMRVTAFQAPALDVNRDRFDLVESLSGWDLDDVLRGDDRDAAAMVGHELDADGIARIAGLAGLLPEGATGFTGGNIIVGGGGSDVIEGRGGNDVIDGDAWLNVRISVRSASDPSVEIATHPTIAGVRAAVFAGTVNPGQLRIVREILHTPAVGDVAVFSGIRSEYDVDVAVDGTVTVAHVGGTAADGTDTVRATEILRFADGDVAVADLGTDPTAPVAEVAPASLAFGNQTTGTASAAQVVTVSNTGDADLSVSDVSVTDTGTGAAASFDVGTDGCTGVPVVPGGQCSFEVTFAPVTAGALAADVVVTHDAAGGPSVVSVSGTGVAPVVVGPTASLPASVDFGIRRIGQPRVQRIRLTNQGPGTLTVSSVATSGAPFTVDGSACTAPIAVGRRCDLVVTFTPTAAGAANGTLTVLSNASNSPNVVALTGTGR